jgi:hypothetical protein
MKQFYSHFFKLSLFLLILVVGFIDVKAQTCPGGTLAATITTKESRCTATGIINVVATGGLAPINYQYAVTAGPVTTPFTSSPSLSGFPPGTYTVTVKDATRNCTIVIPNVIVAGSYVAPAPLYSSNAITCMNGKNGTISLASITGGNDPFTFTFITPTPAPYLGQSNNTGSFTGLAAGTYRIQMSDSCGALQTRDMAVGSYSWSISSTAVTKPTCQNIRVTVNLNNSNGQVLPNAVYTGYQYGIVNAPSDTTWFTTNVFNFPIGLKRSATIVVKDLCGNTLKTVWTDPKPAIAAAITKSNLACNTFTATVTGQTNITAANTTYCLYDAANVTPIGACQASPIFNNLAYGSYSIRTIDACYDTTIVRSVIQAKLKPLVAATLTYTGTCGIYSAQVTGQTNMFTTNAALFPKYCLYDASNVLIVCNLTGLFPNLAFGSNYKVTVQNDPACYDTLITRNFVRAKLKPSVAASITQSVSNCVFTASISGQTNITNPQYTLCTNPGNVVVATNTTGSFTNISGGNYCIKIKNDVACYDTTITRCFSLINQKPALSNTVSTSNKNCTTFTATVSGQANLTLPQYSIYTNPGNVQVGATNTTGIFNAVPYGNYCIKMVNSPTCYDTTIVRCFIENTLPIEDITLKSKETCAGLGRTNIEVTNVTGTAPYTIKLYGPSGNLISTISTSLSPYTFSNLPGSVRYSVASTDACGSKDSTTIVSKQYTVTRVISKIATCPSGTLPNGGGSILLTYSANNTGGTAIPKIIRKDGAIVNIAATTPNYTFGGLAPAKYVIQTTLQQCGALVVTDTVVIEAYKFPNLAASRAYQCDNGSISIGATATFGAPPYLYEIIGSVPSTPSIIRPPQASSIFNINPAPGVSYTQVSLRVVDGCGNGALQDVGFTPIVNPIIHITSNCFYELALMSVDPTPNATYTWYKRTTEVPKDSVLVQMGGNSIEFASLAPADAGLYICETNFNAGCAKRISYFNITGDCGITVNLSGNVYNDINGNTDLLVNGIAIPTPSGTQLYANLLNAIGTVLQTVPIAPDGSYTFPVTANTNYKVQITVNQGVVNSPMPVTALPSDWVNTGQTTGIITPSTGTTGIQTVAVLVVDVPNVNFGIEQLPTPIGATAPLVVNPSGTIQSANAASLFTGTDPSGGIITSLNITAFPNTATSIAIAGILYTNLAAIQAAYPTGIPTNASGVPTVTITVDPLSNGTTTVSIPFTVTDNAGFTSTTTSNAVVQFGVPVLISGNVYNDLTGNIDMLVNGTGIANPSSTQLYANLLDAAGIVIASSAIAADGSYSFGVLGNTTYQVQISINEGSVAMAMPVTVLPSGWLNTGETIGILTPSTGTTGIQTVVLATSNIPNVNFGIEQPPLANIVSNPSVLNPGGIATTDITSSFGGSDPSGGIITAIQITSFPTNATSISIGAVSYTTLAAIQAAYPNGIPTNTAGVPTTAIAIDPVPGAVTVLIPYVTVDNAGISSPIPGSVTQPYSTINVSGNVFNDINGLNDIPNPLVNGIGTDAGGLFVSLINSAGLVIGTAVVLADGTYNIIDVQPGVNYTMVLSTTAGIVGNTGPAASLPAGWVNTGEFNNITTGSDGIINGISAPFTVVATDVPNINFGIEQPPTANTFTYPAETNPGGTVAKDITAAFGGTDPTTNTITSLTITEFPANVTSISIDGVLYTTLAAIQAAYPNGIPTNALGVPTVPILVDPKSGPTTVTIPYTVTDAAGFTSAPGFVEIPFITPANILISGTIFNDINAGLVNSPNPVNTIPSGITAYLIEDGVIVATTSVTTLGLYSFPGVKAGTYTILISTTVAAIGDAPPAVTLPAGWVNTGDFIGLPNTGTNPTSINGISEPFDAQNVDIPNINFGIQQLPTPVGSSATAVVNPGGTTQSADAASLFSGTDPSGGTIVSLTITEFPSNATSIVVGGVTYLATDPIWPANGGAGIVVPTSPTGVPTVVITVDPIDGGVTVSIPFVVTDNAGFTSITTASAMIPFTAPLPIDLINFSAKQYDESIILNWKTANEKDFSHFEVQKSKDAKEFGSIGNVKGTNFANYNMIDNNPAEGINYYRLKMVDLDGSSKLSNIVSVNFEKVGSYVSVENPAVNGTFSVSTNFINPDFTLMNSLGQNMNISMQQLTKGNYKISTYNSVQGIYYLNILSNGKIFTKKVLIN